MSKVILEFSEGISPALDAVEFRHPLLDQSRLSRRGKGATDTFCLYTFQWTNAVRAMCVLFLRTKGDCTEHAVNVAPSVAVLSGGAGSCAASLDYALSKRPLWLLDMFGVNRSGEAIARFLFLRWNPERKRGGDVQIALNPRQLNADDIEVRLSGRVLDELGCLHLADLIEESDGFGASIRQGESMPPNLKGRALPGERTTKSQIRVGSLEKRSFSTVPCLGLCTSAREHVLTNAEVKV